MTFTLKSGALLWAAASLTIPSVASAQDNVSASGSMLANETLPAPALTDLGNVRGTASKTDEMALPVDNDLANDVAPANWSRPTRQRLPLGAAGITWLGRPASPREA